MTERIPPGRMITVCEAITWIAFGERVTHEALVGQSTFLQRWGHWPADDLLALLEARANDTPYCPVEFEQVPVSVTDPTHVWTLRKWPTHPSKRISSAAFILRQNRMRITTAAMSLRAEMERNAAALEKVQAAQASLLSALRDEELTAEGMRAHDYGKPNHDAMPEAIEPRFWRIDGMRLSLNNWAMPDRIIRWNGPIYNAVTVRWREVEALWPAQDGVRTTPPAPVSAAGALVQRGPHRYSREALGAWFLLRVATWPLDQPAPSEADDMAAALEFFADTFPRGEFREIRAAKTPAHWRKSGPRARR